MRTTSAETVVAGDGPAPPVREDAPDSGSSPPPCCSSPAASSLELAGFFTLAALITFGGAYAVLPFVADAAVNHYGWLTAHDMVAGLALGESTPGPLIMVNTFVGFVAGYNVEGGLAWGLVGATIVTLCTFVPSFVFIISGAPIIDRIRTTGAVRQPRSTASRSPSSA